MTMEEMIAEYQAKGGKVTRVDTGVRAISNPRKIYDAARNGGRVAADDVESTRAAEDRAERESDAFRAAKYDGRSDAVALDDAQRAK